MVFESIINTFQFCQSGRIIRSPLKNGFGYAKLADGTIVELRLPVLRTNTNYPLTELAPNTYVYIIFTHPQTTAYPQAVGVGKKKHPKL